MRLALLFLLAATLPTVSALDEEQPFVLAILDTGISPSSAAAARATSVLWYDALGDETGSPAAAPRDDVGHGTAVASAAFLEMSDRPVQLLVIRVLNQTGGSAEALVRGLEWATQHGARATIAAMSFPLPAPQHEERVAGALQDAHDAGNIVVWAAGNGFNGRPLPPSFLTTGANTRHALVVGATDAAGAPLPASNWAPDVVSWGHEVPVEGLDGSIYHVTGSSFAAARVAGMLARLHPHMECDPITALRYAADDRAEWSDLEEGHGRLEAANVAQVTEHASCPSDLALGDIAREGRSKSPDLIA